MPLIGMQKGAIPLINPKNHNFRDREKNKEMDKTGGILVKTLKTTNEY